LDKRIMWQLVGLSRARAAHISHSESRGDITTVIQTGAALNGSSCSWSQYRDHSWWCFLAKRI
ncbi:MAG: hypothetical protein ACFFER_16000, partial [Candidatus Thorarchaeota archaeon]